MKYRNKPNITIADSHEFIEFYRGDKDLRVGIEMCKLDSALRYIVLAPDKLSPNDRARFGVNKTEEIPWPHLPANMELCLLASASVRFKKKESGGIIAIAPGYAGRLAGLRPDIIFENPFSWLTPRSYATYLVSKLYGIPVVYVDPGDDIPVSCTHKIMACWEKPIVNNASAIITYNEIGRSRFQSKYGYSEERIHIIPKPVDVSWLRSGAGQISGLRERWGIARDELVISYLGRLAAYKGSNVLVDVAKKAIGNPILTKCRFVFIGGVLSSELQQSEFNLPNTVVTGMLPHSEIPAALAASDIVVFPDITNPAGFPTAVAETMGAGRPIIVGLGNRTDAVPLRHGHTAWIIPPGSAEEITMSLEALVGDDLLRNKLGENVSEFARCNMDYPAVARQYIRIFGDAVQGL